MDNLSLAVERRIEKGKSFTRRLRRSGWVPGVVYGIHEAVPLTVDPKALEVLLHTRAGANVVFQLNVAGDEQGERPVIVKDLQVDPMDGSIIHADFLEIRMDEKITVSVPIHLKGEAPGVKLGGVLSQMLRELDVICLPNAIPEEVEVDISGVQMGDVVHVSDLALPEGVELETDAEEPVLTVTAPVEEEAEKEEAEAEEGAEGEPTESAEAAADSSEKDES